MKSISDFFNRYQHQVRYSQELNRHKAIRLDRYNRPDGCWVLMKDGLQLTPETRTYLSFCLRHSITIAEAYSMMKLIEIGPKVFRPTQAQFQLLEHMTLNVPVEDFHLPFHTIVFEFPDNYCEVRNLGIPSEIGRIIPRPGMHKPTFLIMHHDIACGVLLTTLMFDSTESVKEIYHIHPGETIEDVFARTWGESPEDPKLFLMKMSDEEIQINQAIVRSAVNYCLLIDELGGAKCNGPLNPSHYAKLQKWAKRGDAKSKEHVRHHPIIYSIDQEVVLFTTTQSTDKTDSVDTGRTNSPHWRRGHFRQQPHGPQNSLRKRIRVPAVFVNADLFKGEMFRTNTVYKD